MTNKLKELRKNHNLTQQQVAEILQISKTGYASWEQGLSEPNILYLNKLANLFGCTVDYLIDRENEEGIIYIMGNELSKSENKLLDMVRQLHDDDKDAIYKIIESILLSYKFKK